MVPEGMIPKAFEDTLPQKTVHSILPGAVMESHTIRSPKEARPSLFQKSKIWKKSSACSEESMINTLSKAKVIPKIVFNNCPS